MTPASLSSLPIAAPRGDDRKDTRTPVAPTLFGERQDAPHDAGGESEQLAPPRNLITVTYQDRRGASCTRSFDDKVDTVAFIARLRCEAAITQDGRKIGEVYYLQEREDKRRKWGWWIEGDSNVS